MFARIGRTYTNTLLNRLGSRSHKFSNHSSLNIERKNLVHTLVLGEYIGSGDNSASLSDATYSAVTAAKQLGDDNKISLLITSGNESIGNALITEGKRISGINSIIHFNDECLSNSLPEYVCQVISQCQSKYNFSHIIGGLSSYSRDVMGRLGGILDVSQISDITNIVDSNKFERSMYAGNAVCQVESKEDLKLLTARLTSFQFDRSEMESESGSNNVEVLTENVDESVMEIAKSGNKKHVSDELSSTEGPSLQSASIVVSGGRGMQNGENFSMLYKLSSLFGDCAVGASRAAVDAGFVSNDLQVGQTGKVVAPNLYMAVGISGAIQHIAGMKDSKIIVAINKDEEAPIFSIADYGLKADLFDAIPQLTKKIEG